MDKPGDRNIRAGIFWIIVGLLLTGATFWLFDWQGGVLFYGAVLVGGIQFVTGAFQRIGYAIMSPESRAAKHAQASLVTLVRCMAMVANADGELDQREVQTIGAVLHKLTGSEMDVAEIRSLVGKVGIGGSDPAEFVASLGTQLDVQTRILVAKACYWVMTADGEVSEDERKTLERILEGLELPKQAVFDGLGVTG